MTPGARLAAAIEVLDAIDASNMAGESIIRSYFRARRYAGSKDRRAIGEKVYSIIRHRARLDWWIAGATADLAPVSRTRVLASLLLLDRESPKTVDILFDGSGHAPASADAVERDLIASLAGKPLHHDAMPEGVVNEVPEWLMPPLTQHWGQNFAHEMAAMNSSAPVDVRVNSGRVSRQQARKSLLRDDIKSENTPLSLVGLRLSEHANLDRTRAFTKGLIEVQDEGSQLIAQLCRVRPGMTVIDYCAGAGGKTLALADLMGLQGNEATAGRLIACDISAKRLARMDDRLKRAGAEAVHRIALEENEISDDFLNCADRVLVDAPCSGTGAWRRHPEARWRLTPERLAQHVVDQQTVLAESAKLVKPGGHLIYATCSILEQENENQVAWFLAGHPEFNTLPMGEIWIETIGMASPPGASRPEGLYLSPAGSGTDGFFCVVLVKDQN